MIWDSFVLVDVLAPAPRHPVFTKDMRSGLLGQMTVAFFAAWCQGVLISVVNHPRKCLRIVVNNRQKMVLMVDSAASFFSLNIHHGHGRISHPITIRDHLYRSAAKAVKIQLTTPVLLRVVLVSMQIWPEGRRFGKREVGQNPTVRTSDTNRVLRIG